MLYFQKHGFLIMNNQIPLRRKDKLEMTNFELLRSYYSSEGKSLIMKPRPCFYLDNFILPKAEVFS